MQTADVFQNFVFFFFFFDTSLFSAERTEKWTRHARASRPALPQQRAAAGADTGVNERQAEEEAQQGSDAVIITSIIDDQRSWPRARRLLLCRRRHLLLPPLPLPHLTLSLRFPTGRTLQEHEDCLSRCSRCEDAGQGRPCSPLLHCERRRRRRRRAPATTTLPTSSTASRPASSPRRCSRHGWASSGSAATCTR
jgi:hypothetical protein